MTTEWIWDEVSEKDALEALRSDEDFQFSDENNSFEIPMDSEDFTFFLHVNYKAKQIEKEANSFH